MSGGRVFFRSLVGLAVLACVTATENLASAPAASPDSAASASTRFSPALGGVGIMDRTTGLIWEQEPDRFHGTWTEAAAHCLEKTVGGQPGWRIPTVKELSSLADTTQRDPALPAGHPFANVRSAIYWTASPSATDDMVAWHVSFFTGEAVTDQKSQTRRVWCVRESVGAH
jgi:hypothetical protein